MKIFWPFVVVATLALAVAACRSQPAVTDYRLTTTIKDVMDSMVDPSADVLWESVATIADQTGVTEKRPQTDEEWATVRHHAVTLLEATNVLLIPGRAVAHPNEKAENPQVELEPAQIEARINADRAAWTRFAHGLHDAVVPALTAIDARDATALLGAGEKIDTACENCHLAYWYPADKNKK